MTVKKGQMIEVDVMDLALGGKGLTRIDGMAVFIDQAVPGDRVQARIVKKRKQYAEARVVQLIRPSEDRVPAPCEYSGFCGGCKWQCARAALPTRRCSDRITTHVSRPQSHKPTGQPIQAGQIPDWTVETQNNG